jgi:hypothetical protein
MRAYALALPAIVVVAAGLGVAALTPAAGLPPDHPGPHARPAKRFQRCPEFARPRLISHGPGVHAQLVPRGARALELCRYRGIYGGPTPRLASLTGTRRIHGPTTIRRLTDAFDALPAAPKNEGFSCPADDGSAMLALFRYAHGRTVAVRVGLRGCPTAGNGAVVAWATNPAGLRLVDRLQRLLPR